MSAIPVIYFNVETPPAKAGFIGGITAIGGGVLVIWRGAAEFVKFTRTAMERLNAQDTVISDLHKQLTESINAKNAEIQLLRSEIRELGLNDERLTTQNTGQEVRIAGLEESLRVAEAEKLNLQMALAAANEKVLQREFQIAALQRSQNTTLLHQDAIDTQAKIENLPEKLDP